MYRWGVVSLALLAAVLLIAVDADTHRMIPLFAIGVFIGFSISQIGLVRHWAGSGRAAGCGARRSTGSAPS